MGNEGCKEDYPCGVTRRIETVGTVAANSGAPQEGFNIEDGDYIYIHCKSFRTNYGYY
jgi:hypothetical protein